MPGRSRTALTSVNTVVMPATMTTVVWGHASQGEHGGTPRLGRWQPPDDERQRRNGGCRSGVLK
jgi:hypothetical protein